MGNSNRPCKVSKKRTIKKKYRKDKHGIKPGTRPYKKKRRYTKRKSTKKSNKKSSKKGGAAAVVRPIRNGAHRGQLHTNVIAGPIRTPYRRDLGLAPYTRGTSPDRKLAERLRPDLFLRGNAHTPTYSRGALEPMARQEGVTLQNLYMFYVFWYKRQNGLKEIQVGKTGLIVNKIKFPFVTMPDQFNEHVPKDTEKYKLIENRFLEYDRELQRWANGLTSKFPEVPIETHRSFPAN